ncbi:methionyl-tRNA formyltransferase [Thiofilum flexile]|uniref:methionyl-tRNA formyltransferase n=1 Tax=Thiofilum flexile TaxID=125627 RepID=UPI00036EC2A6|nr:methionyl-tRNA formyltransferase [Thiofilum flexile]
MSLALRVIFAGTPDFAVPALQTLVQSRHTVVAVYTQPDRPAGRGRKLMPSPVKQFAVAHNISVEQPESLKSLEVQHILEQYKADVMVVAAYGLILPQRVLDIPRYGCLNIHGSLLPHWRGAAPIQRAIEAGDKETGITIMQMAAGLDTGDMLLKTHCPITSTSTGRSIHDQLAQDGAAALLKVLDQVCTDTLRPEKQDNALATYAHKLTKAEALIDWSKPALEIDRKIRAFDAYPTAYTLYKGEPLRFFNSQVLDSHTQAPAGSVIAESKAGIDIATGEGVVRILRLQLAGSKPLAVAEFTKARSLLGERF